MKTLLKSFKSSPILLPISILFLILLLASSISRAQSEEASVVKNYSAIGSVSDVSSSELVLDILGKSSVSFSVAGVDKIESKSYVPLSIADIHKGDRVIVQGTESDAGVMLNRIINLTWNGIFATTTLDTASTTLEIAHTTATSTDEVSTSTADVSDTGGSSGSDGLVIDLATTTDSTISTSTENIATTTDNTTSTTTDSTATSTESTNNDNIATTTEDTSTSTSTDNGTNNSPDNNGDVTTTEPVTDGSSASGDETATTTEGN